MTTTTSYGTWSNCAGALSIRDTVNDFTNGGGDQWNARLLISGALEAIIDDFRDAINAQLPDGVTLHGDEFYGPYPRGVFDSAEITDVIEAVDLGAIVERHDPDNEA